MVERDGNIKDNSWDLGALETADEVPSPNDSRKARGDSRKVKELSGGSLNERCLSVAVVDPSCS